MRSPGVTGKLFLLIIAFPGLFHLRFSKSFKNVLHVLFVRLAVVEWLAFV